MKALHIANSILNNFFKAEEDITHMKLQKLLYYVVGFYYKEEDKYLLDELFQKWDYGPVVPKVYTKFAKYGTDFIEEYEADDTDNILYWNDEKFNNVLCAVIDCYGEYSDLELSDLTHTHKAWTKPDMYADIPKALIGETFKNMDIGQDIDEW